MDLTSAGIWFLICLCISQSAMFSGMNLAIFGISRLRLEVEAGNGNKNAILLLELRKDSNYTLTTILWGNVGVNTLLALLSNSVMTGLAAFIFSTFFITFAGEIIPQGYCSRNALKVSAFFSPIILIYRKLLYPVAKPSAKLLDLWLGHEGMQFFREADFGDVIRKHINSSDAEITHLEGLGAINFLEIDDLTVLQEGESVDPASIISLPTVAGKLSFPDYENKVNDKFIYQVQKSGKKWVIFTDQENKPHLVMDSDAFLRAALFSHDRIDPSEFCHEPVIAYNPKVLLGELIPKLNLHSDSRSKSTIDRDIILVWTENKRVITGTDLLDRLLKGTSL